MPAAARPTSVAVLDDYHGLAASYLRDVDTTKLDITVYRDTILPSPGGAAERLIDRLHRHEVLVTMRERTPIYRELIDALPNLKVILTTGLRNLGIDVEYAKGKGIVVAGTPNAPVPEGTPPGLATTTQHTWSLVLSLVANIPRDNALLPSGSWLHASPLNTYLPGLTLGLLGLGKLGAGTARIGALAFGMKIIAWSPHLTQDRADESAAAIGLPAGTFRVVSKADLFEQSDVLSVHIVLSDQTRGIVGADDLGTLKSTAFLVNTSRGPLIDEKALLDTLDQGRIRGYAGDVFDVEPLPLDSRWRTTKWGAEHGRSEVVLTPHSGYAYEGQMRTMWEKTRENLGRLARDEELQWKL